MRKLMLAAAGAAALASGAAAQEVKLVFPRSGLDESQRQIVAAMFAEVQSRSAEEAKVTPFGAIVISPSFFDLLAQDPYAAGLSGLMQIRGGKATLDEAETAALAACEEARSAGQAACVVGARIEPK